MNCYNRFGQSFTEAFNAYEEALQLIPNDSPVKRLLLGNLGSLFHIKFDKEGNLNDLRKVIEYYQQVVARSKTDLNQTAGFVGLADAFQDLHKRTGSKDDLNSALEAYEKGFECLQSSPSKRITSAMRGAYLAAPVNPHRATTLFKKAIELLPKASPRTLNRDDQQHALSSFSGVSSDTTMVSISPKEGVEEGLRLLELGRGVIISTKPETRSDITNLDAIYPHLATQFKILRDKLKSPRPIPQENTEHATASRSPNRHTISQEFDEIVKTIRNRTGFENFLLRPTISELTTLAIKGPIVYVNTS
jgi:tetratricopeptide (TPR) repeat protein